MGRGCGKSEVLMNAGGAVLESQVMNPAATIGIYFAGKERLDLQ